MVTREVDEFAWVAVVPVAVAVLPQLEQTLPLGLRRYARGGRITVVGDDIIELCFEVISEGEEGAAGWAYTIAASLLFDTGLSKVDATILTPQLTLR